MSWHPDPVLLERYGAGGLDRVAATSVEAHVAACAACRGQVPADAAWLEASWTAVVARVATPTPGAAERVLYRLGLPGHVARLTVAPTAAGRAWLVAVIAALAGAVLLARAAVGAVPIAWLLAVAPLAPVGGVAVAYGRRGSPLHEVELASPFDAFRLLLLRCVAVTAAALGLTLLAVLLTPAAGWAGAWLLPSLALVTSTLALGTRTALGPAAWLVGLAWMGVVLVATSGGRVLDMFSTGAQGIHLTILLVAAAVLARRWRTFDQGGHR